MAVHQTLVFLAITQLWSDCHSRLSRGEGAVLCSMKRFILHELGGALGEAQDVMPGRRAKGASARPPETTRTGMQPPP
jgi:hypothetical protein